MLTSGVAVVAVVAVAVVVAAAVVGVAAGAVVAVVVAVGGWLELAIRSARAISGGWGPW